MDTLICQANVEDIQDVFSIQENLGLSFWGIEDYKGEVSNPDSVFLVAKTNNEVVAFILVRLITVSGVAEIANIGVNTKYQNKKIGKCLLDQIINKLKSLNIKKIELEVREKNIQAINFYYKNNFAKDGIRNNFYQNPIDNAILMSREIAT